MPETGHDPIVSSGKRPNPMSSRGLTLIELMIIMTIMVALTGMAIGSYYYYVDHAREVKSKQQLKEYYKAIKLFYERHNVYPTSLADLEHAGYIKELTLNPWGLEILLDAENGYLYTFDKPGLSLNDLKAGQSGEAFVYRKRYKVAAYEGSFASGALDPKYWTTKGGSNVRVDKGIYIESYSGISSLEYVPELPKNCTILVAMEVPTADASIGGVRCGFDLAKICTTGSFTYELDTASLDIPVTRSQNSKLTTKTVPPGRDLIRIIKNGTQARVQIKIESLHDDFVTIASNKTNAGTKLILYGKAGGNASYANPVIFSNVRISSGY